MKSNYESLEKFTAEITRREQAKQDWLAPTNKLQAIELDGFNLMTRDQAFYYPMSQYAEHQIAQVYNIPIKYWNAMKQIPGLRALNANSWFQAEPKRRMIRILDKMVRAFVSDKFRPFDNFLVVNAIMPILNEYQSDLIIQSYSLTEKGMYLQVRFPSIEAEIKEGDIVQSGFIITNSEIGAGSVDIRQSIWRLVCSNGLIRESIFRKFHVGRSIGQNQEDYSIYKNDTIEYELNSIRTKIRDIVQYTLETQNFSESVNDLRLAAQRQIVNVQETIRNVTKHFNIPEIWQDKMNENIYANNELSQWGVANAVTNLSHYMDNPDNAYNFESIGNQIVKLNDKQWEKIGVN